MRANEIIRGVLDLLDQIETQQEHSTEDNVSAEEYYDDETRRFNQIADLTSCETGEYSNSPVEAYASIEAVTVDAGGGTSIPKHPADIRADSIAMYPGAQHVR